MYPIMELSREPVEPGPDYPALSGLSSSKRNPPEGVPQISRKMLRSNDDIWQQDSVGTLIDDVKVRDVLAIAVVRHRDIHDMVQTEYERTAQEMQDQLNEDASVLSFSKEHTKVQNILYGEYDELVHWKKQETVHRAFGSINEIIMAIPCHVRPRSNWKTKFNAFLTLIWIGRGIVDGIGSLPNEIRNQMAIDSKLVDAMERVYATMSEEEILGDALRLIEALADLEKDRGRCFAGLDKLVDMFKEVMRQGRTGEERI
ncbi:hypothetical protein D6C92_02603 [Aureobasidium pullulans]|nr:hypothetical protein D6C92_02603 [Aureobasidium pullulans]